MKPPIQYHSSSFQDWLLREGTREKLIAWLCWNDPNSCYSDEASEIEGMKAITLNEVRAMMLDQISRPPPKTDRVREDALAALLRN